MFKSINVKTVLIEAEPIENESSVLLDETSQEQLMKKQNKGKVVLIGEDVAWPLVGMNVKYLRNAATPVIDDEDGKEYQVLNKAHVLAEFQIKKGK